MLLQPQIVGKAEQVHGGGEARAQSEQRKNRYVWTGVESGLGFVQVSLLFGVAILTMFSCFYSILVREKAKRMWNDT